MVTPTPKTKHEAEYWGQLVVRVGKSTVVLIGRIVNTHTSTRRFLTVPKCCSEASQWYASASTRPREHAHKPFSRGYLFVPSPSRLHPCRSFHLRHSMLLAYFASLVDSAYLLSLLSILCSFARPGSATAVNYGVIAIRLRSELLGVCNSIEVRSHLPPCCPHAALPSPTRSARSSARACTKSRLSVVTLGSPFPQHASL
jgi:hypothetical protein